MRPHRCTCLWGFCRDLSWLFLHLSAWLQRRGSAQSSQEGLLHEWGTELLPLSAIFPLAFGHFVAFSSALPPSCPCYGLLLAVLAAQHRLHHLPPSQKHGGCSQHPFGTPFGQEHPRLQDINPPAPSIVPRPAGERGAELGVAFKAEAWGRESVSPRGPVAVMFPNTSSCVQCVLQVFLQRSGLFLQRCLYKSSRTVPTCFWHFQPQVGCVYPGDWPRLQSAGAQPAAERGWYIYYLKRALLVARPSLLAVLMKNVASSSFTQAEPVELGQGAGGSGGMQPFSVPSLLLESLALVSKGV